MNRENADTLGHDVRLEVLRGSHSIALVMGGVRKSIPVHFCSICPQFLFF